MIRLKHHVRITSNAITVPTFFKALIKLLFWGITMLISALCKVKKSVKISTLRADIKLMENKFQMISEKIRELLKNSPIEDIEATINALIKSKCTELGLVSREEFDVQTEVLRKTREKLEAVEQELAKYETKTK